MLTQHFLVVDGNAFWDALRLLTVGASFICLYLTVEAISTGLRDSFCRWVVYGLGSFQVLTVVQVLAAYGDDVPLWRVALVWGGAIYTARALRAGHNDGFGPRPKYDLGLRSRTSED